MKDEGIVSQEIQIAAMHSSCNLMRNNSGACLDSTGRLIRYGLGNISKPHNDNFKSSDLLGITTIIITPDMVGKRIGIFTAIEVKKEDWKFDKKLDKREIAQLNFINWVNAHGGMAGFANNVEKLKEILK